MCQKSLKRVKGWINIFEYGLTFSVVCITLITLCSPIKVVDIGLHIFRYYYIQYVGKYGVIMLITTDSNKVTFPCSFEANDLKFNGTVIFNEAQRIIQEM